MTLSESLDCVELDGARLPALRLSSHLLWSNSSTVPASAPRPPASFGYERAIDPDARILFVKSFNTTIARFDLAAAKFLTPLPTSRATPALRCLHFDRTARRLGAITLNTDQTTMTLFSIDNVTGVTTSRLTSPTLPAGVSPVFLFGKSADAPVCSFSAGSGRLAVLFADVDPHAKYAYLANTDVYAMVLDTRVPKWIGAAKIKAPLGRPPSGARWRAVSPSISFVDS